MIILVELTRIELATSSMPYKAYGVNKWLDVDVIDASNK
jgi:hypothetical protein